MAEKSISIRAVAARAGVSVATVSNVLTGKPTVHPALAARVRAAADELGYVADPHASRLRSGKHALAAVMVPDLANPMFGTFVSTLEHLARVDGFDLLVVSSANDATQEAERLKALRAWRPAGLIVIPCDGALMQRMPNGPRPPIVVADRITDDETFDLVAVDNGPAAATVAAHLADIGAGSCLVAGSSLGISNVRERWDGVRGAAGSMATSFLAVGVEPEGIRHGLRERLSRALFPDALFTLDHVTSLLAYSMLAELRLPIPDRIAFASFDETEWMRLVMPAVTAVRQPVEDLAAAAWTQLMLRMAGGVGPPQTRRLACAVTIRGSTPRLAGRPAHAAA